MASDSETTGKLYSLLRDRYEPEQWVRIEEAPNTNSNRYCDMICMGVWQSTGGRVIGHEVKASRADWLKELDKPAKADAFLPYCNQWYIVAANGIVKDGELPTGWGLMELTKTGTALRIRKRSDKWEAKPLTNRMIVLWMRKSSRRGDQEIREKIARARVEAVESEQRRVKQFSSEGRWEKRCAELEERIAEFNKVSGIDIAKEWHLGRVGEVVKMLRYASLDQIADTYARIADDMDKRAKDFKGKAEELRFLANDE